MKKLILILSFFICFALSLSSKERVLLVGIGDYPQESGWRKISSENDVELLKGVLPKEAVITTLVNQAATHEGIIRAIRNLIDTSQPGDTVLIHFSCHGQQMLMEGINDEPDYLDEALVPYDAFMKKSSNYHGENHLKDDELGEHLTNLRKKVGPSGLVVVTIDACYSDSMDRGDSHSDDVIYRGGGGIFGSNEISDDSLAVIEKNRKKLDTTEIPRIKGASNILILSACKSFQKNREIKEKGIGYGSLSYAVYIGFIKNPFTNVDIKDWLNCVKTEMSNIAYTQTPQVRTTLDISNLHPNANPEIEHQDNTFTLYYIIAAIIAFILITIVLLFLWKKSSRKNRH